MLTLSKQRKLSTTRQAAFLFSRMWTVPLLIYLLALAFPPTCLSDGTSVLERCRTERLSYEISWSGIPAGTATLETIDNGDGTCSHVLTARSNPVLDVFYPVRIQATSTVDAATGAVMRYAKDAREGWGKHRSVQVDFSREEKLVRTYSRGRLKRSLAVPEGVQDPISILYLYRLEPHVAQSEQIAITDGKRVIHPTLTVHGTDVTKSPAGAFSTQLLEPHMEGLGGVFAKSPGAKIRLWISKDDARIPVRFESEVSVGRFIALLTDYEPTTR